MKQRDIDTINLGYFGFAEPSFFGIRYRLLPTWFFLDGAERARVDVLKGWYAVSATTLQQRFPVPGVTDDFYRVFRHRDPVAKLGYSLFIYQFDEPLAVE